MAEGSGTEQDEQRPNGHGGRIALLGALAGIVLLAAGFFVGRASEGEGAETRTTTTTTTTAKKPPKVNNRACGHDAGPDADAVVEVFPPTIVSDGQIESEKEGSAGRALLEWWQAYQFGDVKAVKALTSPATIDQVGADGLTDVIELPGPGLQGLEILDASESGDVGTIQAGLLTYAAEPGQPPPNKPTNSQPQTFTMQKEGGEWLFATPEFLFIKLNALS